MLIRLQLLRYVDGAGVLGSGCDGNGGGNAIYRSIAVPTNLPAVRLTTTASHSRQASSRRYSKLFL